MVVKSTHRRKLLSIWIFTMTLTVLTFISVDVSRREREKQIAPPLRHFHRLYSYRTKLFTNQRARNRSVIVKTSNMCFRNKSLTNLTWYLFAEEVSTLFRGTSLTTTLMDQYMKMVAIPYLQKTIGDVVAKILDCKQSCEVQYCSFTQ